MGEFDFTGELEKLDDWKMPELRRAALLFRARKLLRGEMR